MVEPTILATERLVLRPFQPSDVGFLFDRATAPGFGQFVDLPQPYTEADALRFLARHLERDWATAPAFVATLDGQPIGDVTTGMYVEGAVELGWGVHPAWWGRGFATESARAVMHWLFYRRGVDRVFARCNAENVGSWRVMEKLGMRREAHLREHRLLRGQRYDEFMYGILRRETTRH
jgi:RimJ/RimL family protein N-acetyltransferase